jgi:IS30 family transposase
MHPPPRQKHLLKNFLLLPYKAHIHSIASGNGTEFYEHKWITQKLSANYFFAPYFSWERD